MDGITEMVARIRASLDRLHTYEHMIGGNNFENNTVDDMKGNAKDICDEIKTEIDSIKAEIDNWS